MSAAPAVDVSSDADKPINPTVVPAAPGRVTEIAMKTTSLVERVEALKIESQEDLESASTLLADVKAMRKEVEGDLGKPKDTAHKLWKDLCAVFNKHDKPLEKLEKTIKAAIADWYDREEKRLKLLAAQTEAAAKTEDEDDRLAQAAALEEAGEHEAAEALLSEEPVPPPSISTAPAKASGIAVSTLWKGEVTDVLKVARAAVIGKKPNPMALSILKDKKVIEAMNTRASQLAKSLKGELDVPGVKVTSQKSVAGR